MMKMSFDVTAKKLFGVNYERLIRTLFLELGGNFGECPPLPAVRYPPGKPAQGRRRAAGLSTGYPQSDG